MIDQTQIGRAFGPYTYRVTRAQIARFAAAIGLPEAYYRDPAAAGPNILISRERLASLRAALENNPEAEALHAFREPFKRFDQLLAERNIPEWPLRNIIKLLN
ncbi:MAG: MaoC family dehydratase [Oscillochloris sp.]|nr:MaoC family dehydratase [Oscillochloris sp.]